MLEDILECKKPKYKLLSEEENLRKAKNEGLVVIYPKEDQLFLDIDTEEQFQEFKARWDALSLYNIFKDYYTIPSKSGLPNRHIVVNLHREYPIIYRIAMQAMLNSDCRKEVISMLRIVTYKEPIVFFQPKE